MIDLPKWQRKREKITAFQRGLLDEEFLKNHMIDPSFDFADWVARTQLFMALEESQKGRPTTGIAKMPGRNSLPCCWSLGLWFWLKVRGGT